MSYSSLAEHSVMSVPSTRIEPRSGRSSPISDFKNTDLPVPDGPSNTLTSPCGISKVTSSQIRWDPKDLVSPSTWIPMPIRNLSRSAGYVADHVVTQIAGTRHHSVADRGAWRYRHIWLHM